MPKASQPELFVVDGSNIATEGRSQPSLEQLNDAVLAFIEEHPDAAITVVVDATFGHRIAKKEVTAFDEAVANNELVTPPAGAIGRGDAFVLSIANKATAGVLSNDSFQEFHGEYDWLFDEGRLIGGKPVPHVGWVFVARTPVRGPKSRQSVKESKQADKTETKQKANQRVRAKRAPRGSGSEGPGASQRETEQPDTEQPETEQPDPKQSGRGRGRGRRSGASERTAAPDESASQSGSTSMDHVNELMPFLEFVEQHPVGTSCTAQVESYASHGAYARIGDVLIYIPLRLMEDPVPRSARSVLKTGEAVTVVIVGFTPERRSIDAALPHMAADSVTAAGQVVAPKPEGEPEQVSAKKAPARRAPAKKVAAAKSPAKTTPAKRTPAKKTAAKTAAKKVPANKAPAKKAAAKKSAAKKAPAKKTAAKKPAAKKTPAKKTTAKKTAAKKTAAAPAKKAAAKKSPAKKAAVTKTAAKKATS